MYIVDFEYDGRRLSDYMSMVCIINGTPDTSAISFGTPLTWNTIKVGNRFLSVTNSYDEAYTATFQIAKFDCSHREDIKYSDAEISRIMKWLRQKEYKKFKPIFNDESYYNVHFNVVFTDIKPVLIAGDICGFEVTLTTDAPFGYYDTVVISGHKKVQLQNLSDENGYIYPKVSIICGISTNELILSSKLQNNNTIETIIKNVAKNGVTEDFIFSGETKQLSSSTHSNLYNDFNYVFPKIRVDNYNTLNIFETNVDAQITIEYTPIARVGII